jgi:Putative oxidoreductase C terminal domain
MVSYLNKLWTYPRKYVSGAVGSLTHSLLLHGTKYETQLSVIADGYHLRLVDLYTAPKLFVRYTNKIHLNNVSYNSTPEGDAEVVHEWDDDPYYNQLEAFVADVKGGCKPNRVLSTFKDALGTYEFTWGIKEDSER